MTQSLDIHPTDKAQADRELDRALEQSFPASDPPAPARPGPTREDAQTKAQAKAEKEKQSDQLDEALEESFPTSDAPAATQPYGGETPKTR